MSPTSIKKCKFLFLFLQGSYRLESEFEQVSKYLRLCMHYNYPTSMKKYKFLFVSRKCHNFEVEFVQVCICLLLCKYRTPNCKCCYIFYLKCHSFRMVLQSEFDLGSMHLD